MAEHHSSRGGLTPETPPLRTPMAGADILAKAQKC